MQIFFSLLAAIVARDSADPQTTNSMDVLVSIITFLPIVFAVGVEIMYAFDRTLVFY